MQKSNITHAAIVPLIGGMALGQERAFGSRPDYILSYEPFKNNDAQLLAYYKKRDGDDIPYYLLDKGQKHPHQVDVVAALCPCAGLSSLSGHASSDSAMNDWMLESAKYVLGEMKPQVFWGENAPGFAGKIGQPVVAKLRKTAKENGYILSMYRTRTLLHGGPQVRERSFYFFWRGDQVPLLNYFNKQGPTIEEVILLVKPDALQQDVITNPAKPSDDPFYRFVLDEIHGGITHNQFSKKISLTANVMSHIEESGITYDKVAKWCKKQKLDKLADKCMRVHAKLTAGGSVMRHVTTIPKLRIGAFVGHLPTKLTHPRNDRYLSVRECMTIMGLPADFELIDPKRQLNHICQNVPVDTAADAAGEVRAVLEGKRDHISGNLICQFNAKRNWTDLDDTPEVVANLESFI